jgi:hypothetical protein
MAVSASAATVVDVGTGYAAVPTPNNTGSTLCASDAVEQVNLPLAPASGLTRNDLVVVHARGTDIDGGVNNDFIFEYVTGAEVASAPVDPATPPGCVALASINRPGGSAAIAPADIHDLRPAGLSAPSAYDPVRLRVIQTPSQSIPRTAWTTITAWGTPQENIGGGDLSGGLYHFPAAGRYQVEACCMYAIPATPSNTYTMQQQLTNGGGMTHSVLAGAAVNLNMMMPISLRRISVNKGDTVGVQLYNGHPTAAVPTFAGYGFWDIERVG